MDRVSRGWCDMSSARIQRHLCGYLDRDWALVLAMCQTSWLDSGFYSTSHRTAAMALTTRKTRTIGNGPVLPPNTNHEKLTNMPPIKYLSSHGIMTWSIHTLCCLSRSFTSHCQIYDRNNVHWVAIEHLQTTETPASNITAMQWMLVRSQIW